MKQLYLHQLHESHNALFGDFAGYQMPLYYKDTGAIKEHLQVRSASGIFDVSHMGQVFISGDPQAILKALETLIPSNLSLLEENHAKYTCLVNEQGGILDDCIVTRLSDGVLIVVNASRKQEDVACIESQLNGFEVRLLDKVLIALQGPEAKNILASSELASATSELVMNRAKVFPNGIIVHRLGYTGEDGFEISLPKNLALGLLEEFLTKGAKFSGLASRNTLRVEAGLMLYGQDMDETISPFACSLGWLVRKDIAESPCWAREALLQLQASKDYPKLQGVIFEGKIPVREPAEVFVDGKAVGKVVSSCVSPSLGKNLAYVRSNFKLETCIAQVRSHQVQGQAAKLPFVPHNYFYGY